MLVLLKPGGCRGGEERAEGSGGGTSRARVWDGDERRRAFGVLDLREDRVSCLGEASRERRRTCGERNNDVSLPILALVVRPASCGSAPPPPSVAALILPIALGDSCCPSLSAVSPLLLVSERSNVIRVLMNSGEAGGLGDAGREARLEAVRGTVPGWKGSRID